MDREDSDGSASGSAASKISSEEFYVNIMKKMQFGKWTKIYKSTNVGNPTFKDQNPKYFLILQILFGLCKS